MRFRKYPDLGITVEELVLRDFRRLLMLCRFVLRRFLRFRMGRSLVRLTFDGLVSFVGFSLVRLVANHFLMSLSA